MRVYILENHSIKIQNMVYWLAEKSNIEEISLIKNESLFLELAEREPPDVAFIRLGDEEIAGLTIGNKLHQMGNKTDITKKNAPIPCGRLLNCWALVTLRHIRWSKSKLSKPYGLARLFVFPKPLLMNGLMHKANN